MECLSTTLRLEFSTSHIARLTKNKYNLHPSLNLSPIVKRTGQAYVSYDPFNTKCTSINIKVCGSTQQRKFVFNELNSIKKVIDALACQNMQIIS